MQNNRHPFLLSVIGASASYPAIKTTLEVQHSEFLPSAEFIAENKLPLFNTGASMIAGALLFGAIPPLVAAGIGAGVIIGYAASEYLTPTVESEYFPEYIKESPVLASAARIAVPPAAITATNLAFQYRTYILAYNTLHNFSNNIILPYIVDEKSQVSETTQNIIDLTIPLGIMASGLGLYQIPLVKTILSNVGIVYKYTTRAVMSLSAAYGASTLTNEMLFSNQGYQPVVKAALTTSFIGAGYYLININKSSASILSAVNKFVNADEMFLMSALSMLNARVLEKVDGLIPEDPLIRTSISDIASLEKTTVAWKLGLKKGSVPYSLNKVIGAAIKPIIKLSPDIATRLGYLDQSNTPYFRIVSGYSAEFPSTLISAAESKAMKTKTTIMQNFDQDVITSSVTSSCFKNVASSFARYGVTLLEGYYTRERIKALDENIASYCNQNASSELCGALIAKSLNPCVRHYLAYQVGNSNIALDKVYINAILESKDYKNANGFCKFLEEQALSNKDGLDLNIFGEITTKPYISYEDWKLLSSETKEAIQANYGPLISSIESNKLRFVVNLQDYFLSLFLESDLPYISPKEMMMLLEIFSIDLNHNILMSYVFAGFARSITTALEKIYTPIVEKYIPTNFQNLANILPLLMGVGYLTHEISNKVNKINKQQKLTQEFIYEQLLVEKASELLTKDWQMIYASHKGGVFNETRAQQEGVESLLKIVHQCYQFDGAMKVLKLNTQEPTVQHILEEVERGCANAEVALKDSEQVPRWLASQLLKNFDSVFEDHCEHFDKHALQIEDIIDIRAACLLTEKFAIGLGPNEECLCEKVSSFIEEIHLFAINKSSQIDLSGIQCEASPLYPEDLYESNNSTISGMFGHNSTIAGDFAITA